MSTENKTVTDAKLDLLISRLEHREINVRREAAQTLGDIADVKALKPLNKLHREAIPYVQNAVEYALEQIKSKALLGDCNLLCRQCFCRFKRYTAVLSVNELDTARRFEPFNYYACHSCLRDTCFLVAVEEAVLVMDHDLEPLYVQEGEVVTINWFNMKKPFDLTRIKIVKANDFEVEEMVLALKNDMDKKRRKRLRSVPVTVEPGLELSQAKLNLLKDNFKYI